MRKKVLFIMICFILSMFTSCNGSNSTDVNINDDKDGVDVNVPINVEPHSDVTSILGNIEENNISVESGEVNINKSVSNIDEVNYYIDNYFVDNVKVDSNKTDSEDIGLSNSYVSDFTYLNYDDIPKHIIQGWGDNSGGRPSYTIDDIESGVLGDTIMFNTISDIVMGEEKNFVGARIYDGINRGEDNIWGENLINVDKEQEYIVRIYCHNNSPNGTSAIAENVEATFIIPQQAGKTIVVYGEFRSSNATPSLYWDSVVFTSNKRFHFEYVEGSALLENNGIGANGGITLSDDIVNDWTKIGYDDLDGNIPGCYQYSSYVTMRIKAVFDE